MRLSIFLALCGLSSDTYSNMVRRDYAPVVHYDVGDHGQPVKEPGWTEYSRMDVVLTALAVALNGEGLHKQTAAAVVVMGRSLIKDVWPLTQDHSGSPIHFGAALMQTSNVAMWLPTGGPLSDLTFRNRAGESFRLTEGDQRCEKLILSNLNILRRDIEQRARTAGFGDDFTHLNSIS